MVVFGGGALEKQPVLFITMVVVKITTVVLEVTAVPVARPPNISPHTVGRCPTSRPKHPLYVGIGWVEWSIGGVRLLPQWFF